MLQNKFYISVDAQGYLQSLILSDSLDDGSINSPIFTPSRSRHDNGGCFCFLTVISLVGLGRTRSADVEVWVGDFIIHIIYHAHDTVNSSAH